MFYGRSASSWCASATRKNYPPPQLVAVRRRVRLWLWLPLAVVVAALPRPSYAFPGQELLLETQVPTLWLFGVGLGALVFFISWIVSSARGRAAEEAASTRIADLQAENAKQFRQLQTANHDLIRRDKALEQVREELEQLREEHRDFLSITGHRMRKSLETLVSAMNLLARGENDDVRQLAEAALGQCRHLRSGIEDIQRSGQSAPLPVLESTVANDSPRTLDILLIENSSHPSLLARLEANGHKVRRETNGVDGAAAALKGKFDLVLIDIKLPLIDGVETARKIRGDYTSESLLIFGMLENPTQQDRERFIARGLTGIIPVEPSESQLLQLLGWADEKTRGRASFGAPTRTAKIFNAATLERKRDTLGHLAFAELLGDRLANLPKKITAFTSALTGRHWIDAQHQAQAIAGEAESVGLEMVANRLRTIAARLSMDGEREYCRHQRTEVLTLMRSSVQQLKAWREKNVHTEWALR